MGMSSNRACTRAGNHQRLVAYPPKSSTASAMAQVQTLGEGLWVSSSGTSLPSPSLRRQLGFSPHSELLEVLALGLQALARLGRQAVLPFLPQEFDDAELHPTFVLPAAVPLAGAMEHEAEDDEAARRGANEPPEQDSRHG